MELNIKHYLAIFIFVVGFGIAILSQLGFVMKDNVNPTSNFGTIVMVFGFALYGFAKDI